MRKNTQTMPNILVINDLIPAAEHVAESLIHWEFPDEEEPCGKFRLNLETGGFFSHKTDEQEWRDDYTHSIRL